MTKNRSTKRALLTSALALLLCFSMLVGSTFAWFTDSVTSSGNIIKSGTLEIEMLWKDATNVEGAQTSYKDASEGPIFNYDLWEPGYVEAKNIQIKNAGTLALKYQLNIVATGEVSKLADVIDVYYADGEVALNERADMAGLTKLGTLTDVLAEISTTASGNLLATESHTVTLALKMQESAGNDYQGLSIGSEFAVQLMATQLTSEVDSFDNQYDAMATVDNVDELNKALAEKSVKIVLGSNIALTEGIVIAKDQEVAIDLAGYTISMLDESTNLDSKQMILNNGDLTIDDQVGGGKLSYYYTGADLATTYAASTVRTAPGSTLLVKGGTIENLTYAQAVIAYGIDALTNGGSGDVEVTVEGGKVSSLRQSIRVFANSTTNTGKLTITGGEMYGRVIIQNASAKDNLAALNISGGTFVANEYKPEVLYIGGNNGATMANIKPVISDGVFNGEVNVSAPNNNCITGGTFDTDPSAYVVDGYKAVLEGDKYEVVKYATVASTVAELEKALANGENVVLAGDVELTKTLMAKKDAVIDLNGNTMTAPSSGVMFQSQSNAAPSMIITSSKDGAVINAGDNAVLLGYGSTEIYNVEINVDTTSGSPFSVYGDLTIGEGTVINVKNLKNSLINNNGKVNIVIDGAEINVDTFKVNGGAMISLANGTTLAIDNTEVNVGLDTTYTSYFISKANNATIGENCTINVKDAEGAAYGITYKTDANVGDKYAWEKQ